jgi:hypothetical protein
MNGKRIRRCECVACGYVARVSRADLTRGLLSCWCGAGELWPCDPADQVELGLLDLNDLSRRVRTQLCKRMGWEDEIIRTSPSQMPGSRRICVRAKAKELPF